MVLAGCGFAQSSHYFTLHVKNDTERTVTVLVPGPPGKTILAKHQGVDLEAWHSDQPGIAIARVESGSKTLGSFTVHYPKGPAPHAAVRVSAASPCRSTSHGGALHWIGLAIIVAVVLAALLLVVAPVQSPIPAEWRVPTAFVVLWVLPPVVGVIEHPWWEPEVPLVVSLLIALVAAQALLRRSQVAWWILVGLYVGALAEWIYHVVSHGAGIAWTLWALLGLVNFGLLVSASMRRFVRFRGWLAPPAS